MNILVSRRIIILLYITLMLFYFTARVNTGSHRGDALPAWYMWNDKIGERADLEQEPNYTICSVTKPHLIKTIMSFCYYYLKLFCIFIIEEGDR